MFETALIIVLYRPSEMASFLRLARECPHCLVILVDNTPAQDAGGLFRDQANVRYLPLRENRGIATAQNVGLETARDSGIGRVVFFDQDSQIDRGLVDGLVAAHMRLKTAVDPHAFLLGPVLEDALCGRRVQRGFAQAKQEYVPNDLIASSGSVVLLSDAIKVGPLWEELFIGDVDYEWIWRARSMGLRSYQTTKIHMAHSIGVRSVYLFGRKLGLSAPIRYYYQWRNWFWLWRKAYVPFGWRLCEIRNLIFATCYIVLKGPFRLHTLCCASRGIFAGIIGK